MFWTPDKQYLNDPFETEAQLEAAIEEVSAFFFGKGRIYLAVQKLIGAKGKIKNIPDGYLIDLTSKLKPCLYVVENELAIHDPLNHIAVQVLEFSMSFESSPVKLKSIVRNALKASPEAQQKCKDYATANGFDNIDFLLEQMLNKKDAFNVLVIIDELEEELETLLLRRFKFPVEILTLRRYRTVDGQKAYQFEPFLAELDSAGETAKSEVKIDPSALDTIVVPALEEGFQDTFIAENRWYQIRIHTSMIPRIKYIAAYRTAPMSAITHIAAVKNIELWNGGNKYVLNFKEPAKEIPPVKFVPKPKGTVTAPMAPRYTSYARLIKAKSLEDAF